MDRDTVRGRHDLEHLLARLHSGEINLLVGTQMIAKGHDIHGVTLVGVVGCDHALSMPDFRAAERVFQLMTQVSGRAGRGDLPGRVVVQTYYPDHYAILAASTHDYAGFAERELKYRRWMHYPPFGVLANVLVQSEKLEEAAGWSAEIGKWFQKAAPEGVRVLGPCTAPIARIKGHLSLSPDSEGSIAQGAECGSARVLLAARRVPCRHAAPKHACRCGCAAPDVDGANSVVLRAGRSLRATLSRSSVPQPSVSVCSSLPGLKRTALPGVMLTSVPVRGLRPMPVLRARTLKTPNPRSSMRSPAARASFKPSNTVSTAASALVRGRPVRSITWWTMSCLIKAVTSLARLFSTVPRPTRLMVQVLPHLWNSGLHLFQILR